MYMYIQHTCTCVDDKDNCLFSYIQLSSFIFMPIYFHLHHRLFTSPRLHFPKNKSLPVGEGWRSFPGECQRGPPFSLLVLLFCIFPDKHYLCTNFEST